MAAHLNLRSFAWIASKIAAGGAWDRQRSDDIVKAPWRLVNGLTLLFVFTGSIASLAGYFLLKGVPRSEVNEMAVQMRKGTHLLEEPETITFAPSAVQAGFEWRDGRMGVVLTWDPAPYKVRIYRMPVGQLRYIELDGGVAQAFDSDVLPGHRYVYVACAFAETQQEYCSDPVSFEVFDGKWR